MAVKYESTKTMMFKPMSLMPGQSGYGNVKTSRLNKGGDTKWRGKRGKGMKDKKMGNGGMQAYGY